MDPSRAQSAPSIEEDDWDTDGFVIPSLTGGDPELASSDGSIVDSSIVDSSKHPPPPQVLEDKKIYLGPHGAPPSQAKQQDLNPTGRKHWFKGKLKEADRKFSGFGRENKVDTLRALVGNPSGGNTMHRGSNRDWLDPHCQESQFEKYPR